MGASARRGGGAGPAVTQRRYLDRKLKLSLLRAADALETQGSVVKAAATLGMTQPALTKALRELEDVAGCRLFERHPRGVTPTQAGALVVRGARRVLAELRRLDEQLDELASAGSGTVAVGALPVAAAGILPGVLIRLKETHPFVTVRMQQGRTEDLLPLLASGELDLIVGRLYEPAVPDGFAREALWSEPISILARADHPIFAGPATVERLSEYELVLPTVSQRVGQEIEHLLVQLGLHSRAPVRSSSYSFIREMLLQSDALSIMPRLMMVGDLLRGALRVVAPPVAAPERPAGLILPRDRALPPPARALADALRAYVAEIDARAVASGAPAPITGCNGTRRKSDTTSRRRRT